MIVSFVGLGMFLFLCRRLYFVKCKSVFMCGTEEKIEKTRSRFWQFFFFKVLSVTFVIYCTHSGGQNERLSETIDDQTAIPRRRNTRCY